MARPSVPPRRSPARPADRRAATRAWTGGVRFSGFMVIMLGLVVLGVLVLIPTIGTFVDQRQQIRALQSAVAVTQDEVADLQAQQERWKDPTYITTQARERLYYIRPGEVVYLVDNDLAAADLPREVAPVSGAAEETSADWMSQLVRSVVSSGVAETVVAPADGG